MSHAVKTGVAKAIKSMNAEWKELYNAARQVLKPRDISRIMEAGGVAAVESASGRIYAGVCVDTACSLGVCAERNAVFSMITNGEDAVKRVIAIDRDGKAVPPCGACREFIAPSMPEDCHATEIMMDCETNGPQRLENWRLNGGYHCTLQIPVCLCASPKPCLATFWQDKTKKDLRSQMRPLAGRQKMK